MESVVTYFSGLGIDLFSLLKFGCILLLGSILLSAVTRFIFRKQTLLGHSISSAIAIVFIYAVMALIMTVVTDLHFLVTPLPFVTISPDHISFFRFQNAAFTSITGEVLSMIILAFLVNLLDSWLPKGEKMLGWIFWRVLTVAAGFLLHYAANWLLHRYLPQGIVLYAPVILLGILLLMLLTGALKIVLGLLLAAVNPLIAALYTFFFANLIGKQITKAVLTTALLSGVIWLLEDLGITTLSLMAGALLAYLPFLLILIPVWYFVSRL